MIKLLFVLMVAFPLMAQNYFLNIVEGDIEFNDATLHVQSFSETEEIQIPAPHLIGQLDGNLTISVTNLTCSEEHFSLSGLGLSPINNGWPIGNSGILPSQTLLFNVPTTTVGSFIYSITTNGAISIENGLFGVVSIKTPAEPSPKILLSYEMDSDWHLGNIVDEYIYNPNLFFINDSLLENNSTVNLAMGSIGMSMHIELVNMGFWIHRYSFNELSASVAKVDANNVIPSLDISSYLDVFPGERYTIALSAHEEGNYNITLQYLEPFSSEVIQENNISMLFQDYSASIGDVNLDGNKDVLDLVLIIDFMLGEVSPDAGESFRADINSDSQITVQDIVLLVNLILNIL